MSALREEVQKVSGAQFTGKGYFNEGDCAPLKGTVPRRFARSDMPNALSL